MVMLTWLADVLRDAGLQVIEVPGWKTRGRGEMSSLKGILAHHTAGPANATGTPSLNLIINGRPPPNALPGPLSQLYLARSGVWYVVAAGRCNHAGQGEWQGVINGNSELIGVEAENAGTVHDPWPETQMDSYERGCAAILKHANLDDVMVGGHKEYARPRGRKIDPTFDMIEFREDVEAHMAGSAVPTRPVTSTDPARSMLRKGDSGSSVKLLQTLLNRSGASPPLGGDGDFGPATDRAVKAFQSSHGLLSDGLVGPKTWEKLGE